MAEVLVVFVDLRKTSKCDEQVLLAALFYALVLRVVPLFLAMYIDSLLKVAVERIRSANKELEGQEWEEHGLLRLLERIVPTR